MLIDVFIMQLFTSAFVFVVQVTSFCYNDRHIPVTIEFI